MSPRAAASVAMPYHGRPGLRRGRPGPARRRYGSQAPRQNFAGLQRRGAAKEPAPRCGKRKTAYPGRRLVSRSCQLTKTFLVSRQSLPRARPCVTTPSLAPSAGKACRRIGRPRARLAAAEMSGHCHVPDQQRQRVATGPAARNNAFTPWPPTCSAVSAACVEASPRRGEPCVAKRCRCAGRPRQGRVTETAALPRVFLGPGRPWQALPPALPPVAGPCFEHSRSRCLPGSPRSWPPMASSALLRARPPAARPCHGRDR